MTLAQLISYCPNPDRSRQPRRGASSPRRRPPMARPGLLLCWLAAAVLTASGAVSAAARSFAAPPRSGTVVAVFDGDTVQLDSGDKVRLLGIDSPELDHDTGRHQCHALEARDQAAKLLLRQRVRLEYEGELCDRYGRLLAYLHLADGRCVNQELIRSGHAWLYRDQHDFSRRPAFLAAQQEALRSGRGLWGRCSVKEESRYPGNRESYVFHRPSCPYGRRTAASRRITFSSRRQAFDAGYHPCRRCLP